MYIVPRQQKLLRNQFRIPHHIAIHYIHTKSGKSLDPQCTFTCFPILILVVEQNKFLIITQTLRFVPFSYLFYYNMVYRIVNKC